MGIWQVLGDEYVPPVGLPEWKQPSFDDDDHVDPEKFQNAGPQARDKNHFKELSHEMDLAFDDMHSQFKASIGYAASF
jgi:hypothetical protein